MTKIKRFLIITYIILFFSYIMFYNYRIPRENLLNRIGDINSDGEYETSYRDPQRLLGSNLPGLF